MPSSPVAMLNVPPLTVMSPSRLDPIEALRYE
jgi:hypothetical protein